MIWAPLNSAPILGALADVFSGAFGTMALSTGFVAGSLRALAILRSSSTEQVEWMTAAGFLAGAAFGALVLALNFVLG